MIAQAPDDRTSPSSLLLIENDQVDEMALSRAVTENALPYRMTITRSIGEARQVLAKQNFDIILTDYNLSDGTAFDLLDAFAGQLVIFLTGSGNEEIAARAINAGIHDYLIKDTQRGYLTLLPSRIDIALRQKRLTQQLRESEAQLRNLFDGSSDLIQSLSADGRILFANRAWHTLLGYSNEEMAKLNIYDIIRPSYCEQWSTIVRRLLAREAVGLMEIPFRTKDGQILDMEGNVTAEFEDGKLVVLRGIYRNVTERKRAEHALLQAKGDAEKLSAELNGYIAAIGQLALVSVTDRGGRIIHANDRFCEVSGYSKEELIGQNHRILKSGIHPQDLFVDMWETITRGDIWHQEICNRKKNGDFYWVDSTIVPLKNDEGNIFRFLSVRIDVSERKKAEQQSIEMATHDALTGLPNRRLLQDRIAQSLAHARRNKNKLAVLFLDLDHFKTINDSLGHDAGDLLLKCVSTKLTAAVRGEDTVARQGGDEFIILLTDINEAKDAEAVAQKILNELLEPVTINDQELQIGASIGIALFPSDGNDSTTLLKHSDAAMYRAKQSGRNKHQFYQ
ncbi:MAG: diguanylate cyclase [Nitrospirae bacterium]|nr:diguanylate cyclase [Nitrospirota bacterium]